MKFDLWLVVLFALMPVFMLVAGLSVAGDPTSTAALASLGAVVAAGAIAVNRVMRNSRDAPPP